MVSDRTLTRIYAVIVAALLVWPIPHYVLSRELMSDPWKNFGLAMYATHFEIDVRVRYRSEGGPWRFGRENRAITRSVHEFLERRRSRGTLLRPTRLAKEIHAITDAEQIEIQVRTRRLEGLRGQMSAFDRVVYDYAF